MSLQKTKRKLLGYSFGDIHIGSHIRNRSKIGAGSFCAVSGVAGAANAEGVTYTLKFPIDLINYHNCWYSTMYYEREEDNPQTSK